MRSPRVLLIAEAANPEWVSVPLVGWSLAAALRGVADVHLVTQVRNREAILRAGLVEGEDFTALDTERFAAPIWKLASILRMGEGKGWTMVQALSALSYPYFEHVVWRRFGPRLVAGEFDLVHRITPLSPTVPSPIARKCARIGVPFIIGPLNGGVPWPRGFEAERLREREWLSYVRGAYKILPHSKKTWRMASAIIGGSRHTLKEIPPPNQEKCVYIPENAVDPARFAFRARGPVSRPLRACFIGRLVPYKCPDLMIEAAAPLLRDGSLVIDVIGDGPLMAPLRELVEREGAAETVSFHGWLAHQEVQSVAARSDLFVFPSIREFGGAVVLEAMALGIVPVVVDYGGPGEHVVEGVGFKVPIGRRSDIARNLRETLERIVQAPEALQAMSARAHDRINRKYTWARKAEQVAEVYAWALKQRDERPAFF
jgi:glycosyltransferase involved in cell wall biosynthesis